MVPFGCTVTIYLLSRNAAPSVGRQDASGLLKLSANRTSLPPQAVIAGLPIADAAIIVMIVLMISLPIAGRRKFHTGHLLSCMPRRRRSVLFIAAVCKLAHQAFKSSAASYSIL